MRIRCMPQGEMRVCHMPVSSIAARTIHRADAQAAGHTQRRRQERVELGSVAASSSGFKTVAQTDDVDRCAAPQSQRANAITHGLSFAPGAASR